MTHRIHSPLALLCLASGLSAQTPEYGAPIGTVWNGTDEGSIRHMEVLELTFDKRWDLLVLDGDTPVVMADFAIKDAAIPLGLVANAAAARHDAAPPVASILTVGPTGLVETSLDQTLGSFVHETLASTWADAVLLHCAQLDGAGPRDILGVASDKRTLLRLDYDLDDVVPSSDWLPVTGFVAGFDVRDLVTLDWDGDGTLELALLGTTHFEIRTLGGALVTSVIAWADESYLCVLPGGATGADASDALLWVGNDDYLQTTLTGVWNSSGADWWADLGNMDVAGIQPCDRNGDGLLDLAWTARSDDSLRVWNNASTASATSFAPAEVLPFGSGDGDPFNRCAPAVGDVDQDGDLDLVGCNEGGQDLYIFPGTLVDETLLRPALDPVSSSQGGWPSTLTLEFTTAAPPFGATHLFVELRRQAPNSQVQDTAQLELQALVPQQASTSVSFQLGPYLVEGETTWFEARYARVMGGNVRRLWPAAATAMYTDEAGAAALFVDPYTSSGNPVGHVLMAPQIGEEPDGFVPQPKVKPFDEAAPPKNGK